MNNIVLIGFMGTGKSSIARALERGFGYDVIDTDAYIEKEQGMSISEIFASKGEEAFRKMETALIRDQLMNMDNTVISCGGGMPLREENQALLKHAGTVIWLQASVPELMARLKGDTTRPLLACADPKTRIQTLLTQRAPLYEACAHYQVFTDGKTPAENAREIVALLKA
jgi:shikimate kinase